MNQSVISSIHNLKRLLFFLKPVRKSYFFFLCLYSASEAALPIVAAFVYMDIFNAAASQNLSLFWRGTFLFTGTLLTVMVVSTIAQYCYVLYTKKTMAHVRREVTDKMTTLPLGYYQRTHSGDLLSRMTNDLNNIEEVYTSHFRIIIQTIMYSLVAISIMAGLHWKFAIFLIVLCFFSTFVIIRFSRPIQSVVHSIQLKLGKVTEKAVDLIAGVKVIKMYHLEDKVSKTNTTENEELSKEGIRFGVKSGQLASWSYFLNFMNYSGVIAVGIFLVLKEQIGLGVLIAFAQLQWNMSQSILQLGNTIVNMMSSFSSVHRIGEILDEPDEPDQLPTSTGKANVGQMPSNKEHVPTIILTDVSYSYSNSTPTLDRVSFHVEKGQKVIIIGPSGSGKSTLFKLMQGFIGLDTGDIWINGKSIRGSTLEDWRSAISYLPQEPWLFSGTIYENIACGKKDATYDEVIKAAKLANAHEFIMELKNGYDTPVGESGGLLSGGQRQRIAISRAFLKDASILLLDEATSALDNESESSVRKSLELLMGDRTTLLITHRLSVVSESDLILVLQDGEISEFGTHHELLHKSKFYQDYFHTVEKQVG